MNLNPFVILLVQIISWYNFALVVFIILQWLLHFKIINPHSPFVTKINITLYKLIEPVLMKIRKYMPELGGIDLSPLALFLALGFMKNVLITYFYVR